MSPRYLPFYANWYIHGDLKHPGARYWYVAWQGHAVGVKYLRYFEWGGKLRYVECKFGWRITPRDIREGYREDSVRWVHGTTATLQPPGIKDA